MKISIDRVKEPKQKLALKYKEGTPDYWMRARCLEDFGEANIPYIYWDLKLDNFKSNPTLKTFLQGYMDNLKENLNEGKGFCLLGTFGVGKTTACSIVLKKAVINNYDAYYTTLIDAVNYMKNYETKGFFESKMFGSQIVVIDEVDSRHFSGSDEAMQLIGSTFEKIIRYRTQNKMTTLIASNNNSLEEVFTGIYRRVISSISSSSEIVVCVGKDLRKK